MNRNNNPATRRKAAIRPAASVMWGEMPAHIGGAYSKLLVRPDE